MPPCQNVPCGWFGISHPILRTEEAMPTVTAMYEKVWRRPRLIAAQCFMISRECLEGAAVTTSRVESTPEFDEKVDGGGRSVSRCAERSLQGTRERGTTTAH